MARINNIRRYKVSITTNITESKCKIKVNKFENFDKMSYL